MSAEQMAGKQILATGVLFGDVTHAVDAGELLREVHHDGDEQRHAQ